MPGKNYFAGKKASDVRRHDLCPFGASNSCLIKLAWAIIAMPGLGNDSKVKDENIMLALSKCNQVNKPSKLQFCMTFIKVFK